MLIDPTSLKSVQLKFIEAAATLHGEVPVVRAETGTQPRDELAQRLQRLLGLKPKRPAALGRREER